MRGRRFAAVAVRAPSSRIVVRSERLPVHLYGGWVSRTPFLRGLILLWDTLGLGMKALMFSADVAQEGDEGEQAQLDRPLKWGTVALSMTIGIGVFFLLPLGAAGLVEWAIPSSLLANVVEGVLRLGLLVGYIWAIGHVPEIRRVFAYHGAEHMTIHAFEAGDPLDVEHIQRYPPAHPRCGTAFLLLVVAVSIVLFATLGSPDWPIRILSRILGIPLIAGIAYEALRFGGAHAGHPLVKLIVAPGLSLQKLTTRYPEPDMIEVAVAAFEEMHRLELASA
ncbi:MAG: DUF1385 domain-containing protein [Chloroflexi bacterium]|nr:DUF1385 domain-containing protein [Chloroflexota bacterium]